MLKPIRFEKTGSGCHVAVSHNLNADGYFRKYFHGYPYGNKLQMMHRVVWEIRNGKIPDGYEIDHICKNRACSNPDHLAMVEGREHAVKSNTERYKDRIDFGKKLIYYGLHSKEIADALEVSLATVKRWRNLMIVVDTPN